jgi:nicotinamide-nucleotide amidase
VSAALTELPGSSHWFLQGWVTYSNQSKTKELNVPAELITKYGAVSQQVAIAMAEGALFKSGSKSGADIAVATTGVAGPDGGTDLKPVGTVWIAVLLRTKQQEIFTKCLKLNGSRSEIRLQTVEQLLQAVIDII